MFKALGPRVGWKTLATTAVLCIALVAVGLAQTSAGRNFTRKLGLEARSEPYTELYFAHPAQIAGYTDNFRLSGKRISLPFVIHNDTHSTNNYSWAVYVSGGSPKLTGVASLAPGASVTAHPKVVLRCPAPSAKQATTADGKNGKALPARRVYRRTNVHVRVVLGHPAEEISFWGSCYA
jgi:hypothetical protein